MNELSTLFIDTNLDTHLAVVISHTDTVVDLKRKIMDGHSLCFPDLGQISIHAVKVKRRKCYYHLTDHMSVKHAFAGIEGGWFLYVDASRDVHIARADNLTSNGTKENLYLVADLGVNASIRNILKELEVEATREATHMSDDQCNTTSGPIEVGTQETPGGKHKIKSVVQDTVSSEPIYGYTPAADPSSMEGSGQENSKEVQKMNVPDEKADDSDVHMQYEPCFNSKEIGSAGNVVMHEEDKSEPEPTESGKEIKSSHNINEEWLPRESCEPNDEGETEVTVSPKCGNEMELSQNIDEEVVPSESCEPIDQRETGVAIASTVVVNNEIVDPMKSIAGEKKSKKRKKRDGRKELVDSETVKKLSSGPAENAHKAVGNVRELVQAIPVDERLVLAAAKGTKKSRKKSQFLVENISDMQTMIDHGVDHSTLSFDKTKEMDNIKKVHSLNLVEPTKALKEHEDADDSVQPTQSERVEGSIVLPKGKKKSKKKSKHEAEENLSVSTLQSAKVNDDSRQQLNNVVPDSVEVLGNYFIDGKRSEGKNEAILNSTNADSPRATDKHDSETESNISTSRRVSRSHKSDKLMPKTRLSFHEAFTKKEKSVVDKLGKKKSGLGKKTLLSKTDNFFKDGEGVSSVNEGTVDADATKALSDSFSSSDETDQGSYILKRKGAIGIRQK